MTKLGTSPTRYRYDDEIKRLILNYLNENGPTSSSHLEYGIEINNGVMKRTTRDLLAADLIDITIPPYFQQSLKDEYMAHATIFRLFIITDKGKKCMHLMNKRAELLCSIPK
jgi:predicted transcriptional regulator